jgi:hypothetical protein
MVWDNFQSGQELRDQRDGRLSKFLIGTVEVAHHVIPFLNFQWDNRNITMQYDRHQSRPSPLGMRAYEFLNVSLETLGTNLFLNHSSLHVPNSPCFSGDRICSYEDAISIQKFICDISRAFSWLFESEGPGMNTNNIRKFSEYCLLVDSRKFFSHVYKFQRQAVIDWNTSADSVTMSAVGLLAPSQRYSMIEGA